MRSLAILTALLSVAHADKAKARDFFQEGTKRYNMAEYDAALAAFKHAYDEFPDPTLLFNTAQCYRQLGDKLKATTLYKSYLREVPNAPNGDEVRRLISSLDADLLREQATKKQPPEGIQPPATTTQPTAAPTVDAKPPRPWFRNTPGWAIGGTGLALAVIGVGLVGGAVAAENDARTASMLQQQRDLHTRANQLEPAGWAVLGIGGAGIVAGVAVLAAGPRGAEVH